MSALAINMVKGLKGFILLEAACKRKMENCRKKIKQMNRGESPSSEDSSLEDLDEGGGDKSTGPIAAKPEQPGQGSHEVLVPKEEVKEDIVGKEVAVVKKEKGEVKEEACDTMATFLALRTKNKNFYIKCFSEDDGTPTLKCRKCWNPASTTSHSKDDLCSGVRR